MTDAQNTLTGFLSLVWVLPTASSRPVCPDGTAADQEDFLYIGRELPGKLMLAGTALQGHGFLLFALAAGNGIVAP